MLGLATQLLVRREGEVSRPVDNLAVGIVRLLGTEWGPTDEALEHDGAYTPPITALVVAFAAEDLGGDVIRSADSGVRKLPAGLAPGVDLVAVGDRQLDLVDADRVAVLVDGLRAVRRHELLIVRRSVLLGEASRETEVSELNVSASVQEDIVGLDVTVVWLVNRKPNCPPRKVTYRWMKPSLWTASMARTISAM